MTPALARVPPSLAIPAASSRSIHSPDSRVSRPARKRTPGEPWPRARASAAPSRRMVGTSRGYWPALPRTPSVPNNRPIALLSNPNPHVRGLDFDDADAGRRNDFHRQLEDARPKPFDINRRLEVPNPRSPGLARTAYEHRHIRRAHFNRSIPGRPDRDAGDGPLDRRADDIDRDLGAARAPPGAPTDRPRRCSPCRSPGLSRRRPRPAR